ncbi:hypothetical protein WJX73_006053 [Symbiochloris irregularis]|uniref:Uncharacterized protein n=1 Tax=Symbiochloris irregularis TaxID=706552 RepID=A0AAW1NPL1_9CHLO
MLELLEYTGREGRVERQSCLKPSTVNTSRETEANVQHTRPDSDALGMLDTYRAFRRGLQLAVRALDEPSVGHRRRDKVTEVHAAILAQKALLHSWLAQNRRHLRHMVTQFLEANLQMPVYHVVQAHQQMLGACQLSMDQKARLCKEAAVHSRAVSTIAHERCYILQKLAEILPSRDDGLAGQGMKEAVNRQLVATQQSMCDREADARLAMWQAFFLTDVLSAEQSARLQVKSMTVVPDATILAAVQQPPGAHVPRQSLSGPGHMQHRPSPEDRAAVPPQPQSIAVNRNPIMPAPSALQPGTALHLQMQEDAESLQELLQG